MVRGPDSLLSCASQCTGSHSQLLPLLQEDSSIAWSKLECAGSAPSKRSGHTLTSMSGTSGFLFGGESHAPWRSA